MTRSKPFGDLRDRRLIILFCAGAVLLLSALALFGARKLTERRLYDQKIASTWMDDLDDVSQISVFYPYNDTADAFRIRELEYNISQELIKEGVWAGQESELRPFSTCASAPGRVTLKQGKASVTADAIGTWGDFFRFHPVDLVDGDVYGSDLLTPDRILVSENVAWQLFGASDIRGKSVTIGGIDHYIAGVFSVDNRGMIEKSAGIPDNLVFMSIEALCQVGDVSRSQENEERTQDAAAIGTAGIYGINTWEIVMADPVRNFAINTVKQKTGVDKDSKKAVVVENSARFQPSALRQGMKDLFSRGMMLSPIVFPYWENVARGYANLFTLLYIIQLVLTVAGVALLTACAVILWGKRTWTFGGVWADLMDRKYDLECRMHNERDKWKHF